MQFVNNIFVYPRSLKENHHKSIVAGDYERRRSPLRPHSSRRRKFPTVKSGRFCIIISPFILYP